MKATIRKRTLHAPHLTGGYRLPPSEVRLAAPAPKPAERRPLGKPRAISPERAHLLWKALHTRALAVVWPDPEWLEAFSRKVPCGECRKHWLEVLEQHPPGGAESYFGWTVAAHNAVNRRLGKPELYLAEALAIWSPMQPPEAPPAGYAGGDGRVHDQILPADRGEGGQHGPGPDGPPPL